MAHAWIPVAFVVGALAGALPPYAAALPDFARASSGRQSVATAPAGVERESALRVFDLENREVDPFDAPEARAIVFVFTRSDCPVSNRYAPKLERLYRELAPQHVAFRLVYIDPREAVETIRGHLREYGLHLPALRDPRHAIVELAGARVTPEAAVFLPGRRLVYRGRIDNRYADIDKMRPAPTRQDLREALSAILSGTPVTPRTTDAAGCLIADVR